MRSIWLKIPGSRKIIFDSLDSNQEVDVQAGESLVGHQAVNSSSPVPTF
jgi:hypothetical protein